jgi:hypothetical protein
MRPCSEIFSKKCVIIFLKTVRMRHAIFKFKKNNILLSSLISVDISVMNSFVILFSLFLLFAAWHDNWWGGPPLSAEEILQKLAAVPPDIVPPSERTAIHEFLLADDGIICFLLYLDC